MKVEFWWSDRVKRNPNSFKLFVQRMANRLLVGEIRYGSPKKEQHYMTRLIMETKAYKRTGNMEHLVNIANYCWLESEAPENKKFHYDDKVDSVTRREMGGAKE